MRGLEYKRFGFEPTLVQVAEGEPGAFSGKASVYGIVDRGNDRVMPGAFTKSLAENGVQIPICNNHEQKDIIGLATLKDTPEALLVENGLLELELPSARETHIRMKRGMVKGLSIGYETIRSRIKGGIRELLEIKLWEVSIVGFPMLPEAVITDVKSAVDFERTAQEYGLDAARVAAMRAIFGDWAAPRFGCKNYDEESLKARLDAVYRAVDQKYSMPDEGIYAFAEDVKDDYVIVCLQGQYFRVGYVIDTDGNAVLGEDRTEGDLTFVPKGATVADVDAAKDFLAGLVALRE